MDKYYEQAWKITNDHWPDSTGGGVLADAIASALREAAKVPDGHVRLADGRDVKVLGTLPMTADGCVAGIGSILWNEYGAEYRPLLICPQWPYGHDYDPSCEFNEVFSTREAAEAASKAVPRVLTIDDAKPTLPQIEQAMGQLNPPKAADG